MSLVACPTNDYYLATQAEVNAFPGLNCNRITGTLEVSGGDITDLSPLDAIKQVDEYVSVTDTGIVKAENVFEGLEEVGWGIYWYRNHEATHIDGFHNLVLTGDNVDFWYHEKVEFITGFENLVTAGWSLEFGGNPELTLIPDFCSLETISSSLFILDNPKLASITGFRALTHVDWSFQVSGNAFPSEASLCGFGDFVAANDGVYPGGGAVNIDTDTTTDIPLASITSCGFEPCNCPAIVAKNKDCNGSCAWSGKNKVCYADV